MQVPLNWRLAPPEWRFILEDCGARLLLATPDMFAAAQAVHGVVLDATALDGAGEVPEGGRENDPVLLVYTSGTTGRPKGAVLDQRALHANALNARHAFAITPEDRVLTVLPLFHVGGLNIQTTPALQAGAEVILHPRFDPDAFFDSVARDRPTLTLLVPAVMQALVAHPRWPGADLSSLRAIGAGSSDVPIPLIEAFHACGVPVQQVYGATETCPIAIIQDRAEALAAPGSLGRPALHAEARIAGGAIEGEILVRGPATLRAYWPDRHAIDAEGWFATGDVGRIDPQGRFWFTDRLKHVIISGGGEHLSRRGRTPAARRPRRDGRRRHRPPGPTLGGGAGGRGGARPRLRSRPGAGAFRRPDRALQDPPRRRHPAVPAAHRARQGGGGAAAGDAGHLTGPHYIQPSTTQVEPARLDSTAAAMKRMPRSPSSMPGTSWQAGSGARPSRRARICSAKSR
jgi:hypothetical protein